MTVSPFGARQVDLAVGLASTYAPESPEAAGRVSAGSPPEQLHDTRTRTALMKQAGSTTRITKEQTMASDFLSQTKVALQSLVRAQHQRERQEAVARERFLKARSEYDAALARAAALEGAAWKLLLDVPGMTVRTAAALGGVSVATVHRRLKEARNV